jgi:hypothetical protein
LLLAPIRLLLNHNAKHHQEPTLQELATIKKLQLHVECDEVGWNALHYAAATHKVKLVQQLLDIGADPAAEGAVCGLTPLHLACMGRVRDSTQMVALTEAKTSLKALQVSAVAAMCCKQANLTKGNRPLQHMQVSIIDTCGLYMCAWMWLLACSHLM